MTAEAGSAASAVSIVIVSFNAREHLRRCLETIAATQQGAYEVIVVDNASPDGSAAMVADAFPQVRLLRNDANLGFAPAANMGARGARAPVIAFLNPDCIIESDAFSAPAAYLMEHPEVGAAGIRIMDPAGTLQLSVRRFPSLAVGLFNRYSPLTRWFPGNRFSRGYLMSDWDHDAIADVDWVSGACMLTTRAAIDRVGYFDEGYFWGFEDVDFCQRLHRAGLQVMYFPKTSVIHEIGASARTVPAKALIARHRGMWRYYRVYLSPARIADPFALVAIAGRCVLHLAGTRLSALARQPAP